MNTQTKPEAKTDARQMTGAEIVITALKEQGVDVRLNELQDLRDIGIDNSPEFDRFTRTLALGSKAKLSQNLQVRAEWHYIVGTAIISRRFANRNGEDLAKYWNLFVVQLAYSF